MSGVVIDCVMFRGELEMLEGRLEELDGLVERHVIVESTRTHRGEPKPLVFAENKDRFAAWKGQIVHVVADTIPGPDEPGLDAEAVRKAAWAREHQQRDAAMSALRRMGLRFDDRILISDVDEIPAEHVLTMPVPVPMTLMMRLCMYGVDWEYPQRHPCSVIAPWSFVRQRGLAAVRDRRGEYPLIADAGFHLTWLGAEAAAREKLAVTCHLEMTDLSRELLASGRCYREGIHHTGDFMMRPVDVDETWPQFIYERHCPENWFRPRS